MATLNDNTLILVIQNMQLAIDYQHKQLADGLCDEEDVADLEDYLVQADLVLSDIKKEYERQRKTNPSLPPVSEIPRIDL